MAAVTEIVRRTLASPKAQEQLLRMSLLVLIWLWAFSIRLVRLSQLKEGGGRAHVGNSWLDLKLQLACLPPFFLGVGFSGRALRRPPASGPCDNNKPNHHDQTNPTTATNKTKTTSNQTH